MLSSLSTVDRRLAAVAVVALLSACSLRPDANGAGDAARQFHDALAAADPLAACQLLAPGTRQELEDSAQLPCSGAIADEDLPTASTVQNVEAYVRSARVFLDGDVVFVALYGDAWLVTAAGCQRGVANSYDCLLKGG